MKKFLTLLMILSSFMAYTQSTTVVISQVYGGGGSASGTYNADFVELHNVSNVDQDISGYKILYGSATGNLASSTGNAFQFPATGVIIPAGGYLLVATVAGTGLAPLPVTPDQIFTLTLSGTNGKVAFGTSAMVNNTNLAGQPAGSVIDFVGYGTANESETAACPALSTTNAAFRAANGCQDTNNNSSDFTLGSPNPRNSASPVAICGVTPLPPSFSVTSVLTAFGNVCINTTAGPNSFAFSGTNLTAGDITVGPLTGYTFASASGGPYSSSLTLPQSGGSYSGTVYVLFNPTAVQSYAGNIAISGAGATAVNVAASGFGVDAVVVNTNAATGVTSTTATLPGSYFQGCEPVTSYGIEYSSDAAFVPGTGTQELSSNLSGSSFSVSLSGLTQATTYYYVAYATTASGTVYGSTVLTFTTGIESTGGSGVKISQIFGGGGGATGTYNADYVELHNSTAADQDISGCKIMYGSAAGNLGSTSSNVFSFPAGTVIPSGAYILVATLPGLGLANLPVSSDYTFSLTISGTNGKVAFGSSSMLANNTLAGQPSGSVFDFIGYGTANESETAPIAALSATTAAFRNNNGCDDTDDNLTDVSIAAPLPRNSASPIVVCSALPVVITNFDARKNGDKVQISWSSALESGLRDYLVERSADGIKWQSISTVQPTATNSISASYSVIDPRPLSGLNLYRLKSQFINGSKEYSIIKSVVITKGAVVIAYPNPATDQITVYMEKNSGKSTTLQMFNSSGKLLKTFNTIDNTLKFDTRGMSKGMYLIKVITDQKTENIPVIIQ